LAPHFPNLEILSLLGQGGMGAVYKARQLKLDRFVAIKILPAEWGRDPAFAERFTREARALARLAHPHIVAVHDFGEAGGHFYLLMEYVDGVNLRQLLQAGRLEPDLALRVIPQVCDALQYAHEEGIVHRDVKPANILVDHRGGVKIADFGLAKLVGPSRASFTLTGTHQVMGTLDYMAPEQRNRPQEVDHRADIYALGVVFYEMLTGELPLGRFSPPSRVAGVDGRLDEVVLRALEREPEQRYQKVSEVKGDLEAILGGEAEPAGMPAAAGWPGSYEAEHLLLRVRVPAALLILSALVGVLCWAVIGIEVTTGNRELSNSPFFIQWIGRLGIVVVPMLAATMIVGALKMRRCEDYELAIIASILAMAPWSYHIWLGIPAALWSLEVLLRNDVKAAFASNLRRRQAPPGPQPTGPLRRRVRSFFRSLRSLFVGGRASGSVEQGSAGQTTGAQDPSSR
jgi:hypothetical protein